MFKLSGKGRSMDGGHVRQAHTTKHGVEASSSHENEIKTEGINQVNSAIVLCHEGEINYG